MSRAAFVLYGIGERRRCAQAVMSCPPNSRVEIKAARRSLDANSMMWALLTDIARQVDWYGQKLNAEDWKDVFTASLRRARVVPGLDAGSFVPLGMRTSDMSKAEMGELIELIQAFGAERGVAFSQDERAA